MLGFKCESGWCRSSPFAFTGPLSPAQVFLRYYVQVGFQAISCRWISQEARRFSRFWCPPFSAPGLFLAARYLRLIQRHPRGDLSRWVRTLAGPWQNSILTATLNYVLVSSDPSQWGAKKGKKGKERNKKSRNKESLPCHATCESFLHILYMGVSSRFVPSSRLGSSYSSREKQFVPTREGRTLTS